MSQSVAAARRWARNGMSNRRCRVRSSTASSAEVRRSVSRGAKPGSRRTAGAAAAAPVSKQDDSLRMIRDAEAAFQHLRPRGNPDQPFVGPVARGAAHDRESRSTKRSAGFLRLFTVFTRAAGASRPPAVLRSYPRSTLGDFLRPRTRRLTQLLRRWAHAPLLLD